MEASVRTEKFTSREIASVIHATSSGVQTLLNDSCPSPPWESMEDWQQQLAADNVEEVQTLIGRGANRSDVAKDIHNKWVARYVHLGWVQGNRKDAQADPPTHPLLVPWEKLAPEHMLKNYIFVAIVVEFNYVNYIIEHMTKSQTAE